MDILNSVLRSIMFCSHTLCVYYGAIKTYIYIILVKRRHINFLSLQRYNMNSMTFTVLKSKTINFQFSKFLYVYDIKFYFYCLANQVQFLIQKTVISRNSNRYCNEICIVKRNHKFYLCLTIIFLHDSFSQNL